MEKYQDIKRVQLSLSSDERLKASALSDEGAKENKRDQESNSNENRVIVKIQSTQSDNDTDKINSTYLRKTSPSQDVSNQPRTNSPKEVLKMTRTKHLDFNYDS